MPKRIWANSSSTKPPKDCTMLWSGEAFRRKKDVSKATSPATRKTGCRWRLPAGQRNRETCRHPLPRTGEFQLCHARGMQAGNRTYPSNPSPHETYRPSAFNDERYGGNEILRGTQFSKYKQFIQNCFAVCPRQALHARTLGFIHPRSGQEMYFTSELPADMTTLLERWRSYTAHRGYGINRNISLL